MNTNTFLYIVGSACFRIGSAELRHVPPTAFNLSGTSLVPGLSIRTRSETLPWPRVSREVALGSRSTLGALQSNHHICWKFGMTCALIALLPCLATAPALLHSSTIMASSNARLVFHFSIRKVIGHGWLMSDWVRVGGYNVNTFWDTRRKKETFGASQRLGGDGEACRCSRANRARQRGSCGCARAT